ncbi:MAG: hypothetical protein J6T44_00770 [Prevotella sp.]|nr:hypothetical protein [Prevotella sp.]
MKVAKVKKRSNGDVEYKVLNDIDTDMRWLKWGIIILIVAVLCRLILKSFGVISVDIVVGILASIGFGIIAYLVIRGHSLGKTEGKFVINIINDVVVQDAEGRNQKVLKVKFCSDSLDSYGTIDEEYVLALMSDKTILKYPIKQLNRKDEKYNHKLIVNKGEVCKNDEQKKHILRKSLISKVAGSPLFINLMTWGVIALILGFGIGVLYLIVKFVHSVENYILLFVIFLGLLAFVPLYELADKRLSHNRFCEGIRYVLRVPIGILGLTKLVMPSLTIMVTLGLMFAYSFLPVFGVVKLIELAGYSITIEGKLFIFLTFPLIIATHCSNYIRGIILRMSPFSENDHHYHLFERELVRFVYTKENLNFIVYATYFLFLFVSTFKNVQSGDSLLNKEIDIVVAKSFLVFIACTNMLDRKKSSNLEGGELLTLFVKMMIARDDEEWRMKRKNHQLKD